MIRKGLAAAAGLAWLLPVAFSQAEEPLTANFALAPEFEIAAARVVELEGHAGSELLLVGTQGEVRVMVLSPEHQGFLPLGGESLVLPSPAHTLLDFEPATSESGSSALLVLSPEGARRYPWRADQGFDPEPQVLAARARCNLRVGQPTFAPILRDIDDDGLADLIVPEVERCTLWRRSLDSEDEKPRLTKAATLPNRAQHDESTQAEALTDELSASFTIPSLKTRDLNGDGREDLYVEHNRKRAFHLQREDGSFSGQPDVEIDLNLFHDTTPRPELQPGEIVPGGDNPEFQSADLDGDGIPDYVISHRRKVWIFLGTPEGPRFDQGARVLKVSEDVTAILILDVDQDVHPDLVLLKMRVPTISRLILGLVSDWEVGAHVLGFRNEGEGSFGSRPAWDRELALELPPLLEILRSPDKIFSRVQELGRGFETTVSGQFAADGGQGLALLASEPRRLRLWYSRPGEADASGDIDAQGELRGILFESERTRWELDEIFDWIGGIASARIASLTSGRKADAEIETRSADDWLLLGAQACDLDADGREELLVGYEERARPGRVVFDWVRF